MHILPWASIIHDNSNKLVLFKAYVPLIGAKATALLSYLCDSMETAPLSVLGNDDQKWIKQNIEWMAYQSSLTQSSLRRAKERLIDAGLVDVRQDVSNDRTSYWRVDFDKLSRFFAFSHALRAAMRPDNTLTVGTWHDFVTNHPDIVEEFRPLYPRLNDYMPSKRDIAVVKRNLRGMKVNIPVGQEKGIAPPPEPKKMALNVKSHMPVLSEKKASVEQPKKRPCRFVEHWNKQDSVPKCKIGSKSYEFARRFFAAHRRFEAGTKHCTLGADEQERLRLNVLNRIPPNAPRVGRSKIPVRTDKQMFAHIEMAALCYHADFAPANKKKLPATLSAYLYNSYSKAYGITSGFLSSLLVFRPVPLDDVTYKGIIAQADPSEMDTVDVLKHLFDMANNRDEQEQLSLRDLKSALLAARSIIKKYEEIPISDVPMFSVHFGTLYSFLERYALFAEDETWEGMPISALHPDKDIWRRFVDFVGDDIGYHLFTGERL